MRITLSILEELYQYLAGSYSSYKTHIRNYNFIKHGSVNAARSCFVCSLIKLS